MYRLIIISVIILSIITIIIVTSIRNKQSQKYTKSFNLKMLESSNQTVIDKSLISLPIDGFNYTISFWLYLEDYTHNFEYWRHILHIGDSRQNVLQFKSWKNIEENFKNQSPGIWMFPKKNRIRIAFTTLLNKEYCNTIKTQRNCIDNNVSYCSWIKNKCLGKDQHAINLMGDKYTPNNISRKIIEYIDLDIPFKKPINISFHIDNRIVFIYLNGKLSITYKLNGDPLFNNENLYFFKNRTLLGSLYNFYYIPNIEDLSKFVKNSPKITH